MVDYFFNGKFFANPFYKTFATDVNDLDTLIKTDVHEMLEQEIKYDIYQPIRLLLQGERGIGKSMAILYAKKLLEEKNDPKIVVVESTGLDEPFSGILTLLQKVNERIGILDIKKIEKIKRKAMNFYEVAKAVDECLGDMRVVVLVDIPDVESMYKHFTGIAETLQWLIYFQKFAIIMALNYNQIKKFEKHSTILGKFSEIPMRKLTCERTKQLVELRLRKFKNDESNNGNLLFPFTDETIQAIHEITTGIPRAIIKSCSRLFCHASSNNIPEITKRIALPVLSEHYAEDLINLNEADLTLRAQYFDIYRILKENGGKCMEKMELISLIKDKIGGSYAPIKEKLNRLESWGVISMARDKDNMIAKTVFLRAG